MNNLTDAEKARLAELEEKDNEKGQELTPPEQSELETLRGLKDRDPADKNEGSTTWK